MFSYSFSFAGKADDEGTNPVTRQLFSPVASRSTSENPSKPRLSDILTALAPTFSDACILDYAADTTTPGEFPVPNYAPFSDINLGLFEELLLRLS